MRCRSCCVVGCKNNKNNTTDVKFYKFPISWYKSEQRKKWIHAVKMQTPNKSWEPTVKSEICSMHFVGNVKSDNMLSPNYVPTVFHEMHKKKLNETADIQRHERFMRRRNMNLMASTNTASLNQTIQVELYEEESTNMDTNSDNDMQVKVCSQACQIDFLEENSEASRTFICNRYIINNVHEAETQTEICLNHPIKILNRKRFSDKGCGTPVKAYIDKAVDCDTTRNFKKSFQGVESIVKDDQLIDLAGVPITLFKVFADKLIPEIENCKVSKENRLLIFFMKLKTGLSYSALGVLFQVHRTTISRIFIKTLQYLSSALRDGIKWFDKDIVQGMTPECFKPKYSNVRIIIDCTEFPIEIPAGVDERIYTYSHYKKGFTAKVLIGCTPNGLITFKSKCAGGRMSDSQITISSGLLDLLEDDDVILADKGFPQIRTSIAQNGKRILVIMPPFLNNPEFTNEETIETYNVASVRIHIERIMQRIKSFNILNKIPATLFQYIDDIIHICCILVNLQPPIIAENN